MTNEQYQQRKQKYQEYLQSAEWAAKREQVLKRDGYKCKVCGAKDTPENPLHVHHWTYENVFNEPLEDLITVCKKHHHIIHHC